MKALIVIDMLNDFVLKNAPLEVPEARGIIKNIRSEISKAHRKGIPVLYVCDTHKKDDKEFNIWPAHAVKGTEGQKVVRELKPGVKDYVVSKTTYSGFFKTGLERLLKKLDIKDLTLTGVCTNICILYTASDATLRGYNVTVLKDCVAALTGEDHEFALRQMTGVLKAKVV
ncbi:MAG: cysteine hydrolase [Candidatus Omnitrophica bacterium]|nr:cysteine hydrolase [Candidatus Omnitrophota bacterium]